jgi:hypothetical protein
MRSFAGFAAALCASKAFAVTPNTTEHGALPTVDLGYQIQQATDFNSTGQYYNFSNSKFHPPFHYHCYHRPDGREF